MMKLVVLAAIIAIACARTTLYNRQGVPELYTKLDAADVNQIHTIHIALPQRNVDKLAEHTLAAADPASPLYGDYWTHQQILDLIAPDQSVVTAVMNWLQGRRFSGLVEATSLGDAIKVTGTVGYLQQLLSTKFFRFEHESGKVVTRNWGPYSVPDEIAPHIVMITGVADFGGERLSSHFRAIESRDAQRARAGGANNACNTPYTIRLLYNVTQSVTSHSVSQGPYAQWPNGPEGFGAAGLAQWVKLNELPSYVTNVTIFGSKASAYTPQSTGDIEAQLDMQMQSGIGQGAQQFFAVQEGWMYEFGQSVFSDPTAPWVISMSYGWPEENQCDANVLGDNCKSESIPGWRVYLVRAETEFLKITATGRTIIASSGDTGAPGDNNSCDSKKYPLHPGYPATGAWLLSVGGTTLANTAGTGARELDLGAVPPICSVKGCTCSTSTQEETCTFQNSGYTAGGGFSLIIPQPRWQQAAVAAYLKSGATVPAAGKFNSSMRAFPDVTGIGENVLLIGPNGFVGGTSASCPLWAGLVSLLNDYRFSQGLKPMGHINPLIYAIQAAHPDYFNDITTGCNDCTESGCCQGLGYCATTGWDAVTGAGSPNFGKIFDYVKGMTAEKYPHLKL